jgi:hypothetical protein
MFAYNDNTLSTMYINTDAYKYKEMIYYSSNNTIQITYYKVKPF